MPTRHEYTAAMQNPGVRFKDPELSKGHAVRNASGQPIVYSGQFASVYRVSGNGRDHAVRCFIDHVPHRQRRYSALSAYLNMMRPPSFVPFQYLDRELLVNGERHPVVKMDWVEGLTLDRYVDANRNSPSVLDTLTAEWLKLVKDLQGLPMAHNDLQHGNVMVTPAGGIRLVDYDGVFLDLFRGQPSPELGHRNYQHPGRTGRDYDTNIDNFPALVIHLSLSAVGRDPSLWDRFHNGDNLLFTKGDFARPGATPLWSALAGSPDPRVRRLMTELERCCRLPVAVTPRLETINVSPSSTGATPVPGKPPPRLVLKTTAAHQSQCPVSGISVSPSRRLISVPRSAQTPRQSRAYSLGTRPQMSSGPNLPLGQSQASVPIFSAGLGSPGSYAPVMNSSGATRRPRLSRAVPLARMARAAAALSARVSRKVGRMAIAAMCATIDVIRYWDGERIATALCFLAMLILPAVGVLAVYYLIGNFAVTLTSFLMCAVAAAVLYAFFADRY